jgi:hypothetical protein
MDPQAAWIQLLNAYHGADWDQVETSATALYDWLHRGGFPPQVSSPMAFETVCLMALDLACCKRSAEGDDPA